MAGKQGKKRPQVKTAAQRARAAMSKEARAGYDEVQKSIAHLEKSFAEIQRGLRKAERSIEADARARIQALRKEARTQLAHLHSKRREAAGTLKKLSVAAGDSWREIKQSADSLLTDARDAAAKVVDRFRNALRA